MGRCGTTASNGFGVRSGAKAEPILGGSSRSRPMVRKLEEVIVRHMATLPYSAAVARLRHIFERGVLAQGNPRRDARAVLLRAIASARSREELDHLRELAAAHPGHAVAANVERAIASRRRALDRARRAFDRARRALDRVRRALDRASAPPNALLRAPSLARGTGDKYPGTVTSHAARAQR